MPKGGARHFAKPYIEPSVLLQVLAKRQGRSKIWGHMNWWVEMQLSMLKG